MRERPILFSGEMVRAILDGRKTQARRVMKYRITGPNPPRTIYDVFDDSGWRGAFRNGRGNALSLCPHGLPGDRLWVRECFWPRPDRTPRMMRDGADTWAPIYFDADLNENDRDEFCAWGWKRKPSIHMPRSASRLTLELIDVRVERLRDISEMDARAEGFRLEPWKSVRPEAAFRELWDSINAKRGYGWETNPWVWALTFKRVESNSATEAA